MNRINNYNGCSASEFSKLLHVYLDSCTKAAKSKVSGASKEMCKAAFYKMMAAGVPDHTALSEDHQLTMRLCANMSGSSGPLHLGYKPYRFPSLRRRLMLHITSAVLCAAN